MKAWLILILVTLAGPAHTEDLPDLMFGPEFTFHHPDANQRDLLKFLNTLKAKWVKPGGFRFDPYKNTFISRGWDMHVSTDIGVIEVTMRPMTAAEFREHAAEIQKVLFDTAAEIGYVPALFLGGGHINIGSGELAEDKLLARNFMVDLLNHSELFMGIFGYDTHNALPFALMDQDRRESVAFRIEMHDQSENRLPIELLSALKHEFIHSHDSFYRAWKHGAFPRDKHHAVNLTNVIGLYLASRLEIRGVRPQASADVFARQIELLQARFNYLKTLKTPIPLELDFPIEKPLNLDIKSIGNHILNPPADPQVLLERFHRYVRESGQLWQNHRDYLWPYWHTDGELEKYETSPTFFQLEKARLCELRLLAS